MSAALRSNLALSAACVTCLLLAGYVEAQQVQQPSAPGQFGNPAAQRAPANPAQSDQAPRLGQPQTTHFRGPDAVASNARSAALSVDHYLANCLQIKNQAEIELNEFAEGRAENPKVKQFAQQMVEEHRQIAERLGQLTGTNRTAATGQPNQAAVGINRAAATAAGDNATLNQLLQIDRQITEKCVSMARDKLAQESGAKFDKCFIGMQIGSHAQMLAALEVISQQSDGQLQQTAQDAKATVQKHLKHAEDLMRELEAGSTQAASAQARS